MPNEVVAQSVHHHKAQNGQVRENGLELERFIPLWVETIVLDNLGPVQSSIGLVVTGTYICIRMHTLTQAPAY